MAQGIKKFKTFRNVRRVRVPIQETRKTLGHEEINHFLHLYFLVETFKLPVGRRKETPRIQNEETCIESARDRDFDKTLREVAHGTVKKTVARDS